MKTHVAAVGHPSTDPAALRGCTRALPCPVKPDQTSSREGHAQSPGLHPVRMGCERTAGTCRAPPKCTHARRCRQSVNGLTVERSASQPTAWQQSWRPEPVVAPASESGVVRARRARRAGAPSSSSDVVPDALPPALAAEGDKGAVVPPPAAGAPLLLPPLTLPMPLCVWRLRGFDSGKRGVCTKRGMCGFVRYKADLHPDPQARARYNS